MASANMSMSSDEIINDDFWTINTFIFLDLETTGLIKEYEPLPRVTEIALVAVSRDNFLNCKNGLPRVLHKLVLPVNPNTIIPTIVQNMTKMSEECLKKEKSFDEDIFVAIKLFMKRLQQPICFVSHNGNKFDFPLFLNELHLVKQDFLTDLPENLLCLDTLAGFKDILKNPKMDISNEMISSPQSTSICKLNDHTYPKTFIYSSPNNRRVCPNTFSPKSTLDNFKLPTIYKFLHGCSAEQEHSAEGDCLTLIKCCLKVREQFVYWSDLHASMLKNYQLKHAILRNCY